MKYVAEINVMPHKNLLDPQGKAVSGSMAAIGLPQVSNVRVGKHISLEIEALNENEAFQKADEACKKLLANQVMEYYEISIHSI
ncbi:MAG: phosphoribosylformylglycinamidine synthase subunit PurS [Bacteroidetes bacterium]|nr:phosphoribosylformylglycinamidine synthase subunit PurS [Bacteroidota bacterium]